MATLESSSINFSHCITEDVLFEKGFTRIESAAFRLSLSPKDLRYIKPTESGSETSEYLTLAPCSISKDNSIHADIWVGNGKDDRPQEGYVTANTVENLEEVLKILG